MLSIIRHLRHRPSLLSGLAVAIVIAAGAASQVAPVTALLVGWDCGIVIYCIVFTLRVRHSTPERLKRLSADLDTGASGVLFATIGVTIASLGAIVAELAGSHGKPHAVQSEALAGATVLLSWVFIHTIFATHYAREYWHDGKGLLFPGNPAPDYGEFLYFSYCMAVAFQVSDVATQTPGMRRLVLVHSLIAYVFNTAVIALGVNIAASLAS